MGGSQKGTGAIMRALFLTVLPYLLALKDGFKSVNPIKNTFRLALPSNTDIFFFFNFVS